jgi:hypothetical protein
VLETAIGRVTFRPIDGGAQWPGIKSNGEAKVKKGRGRPRKEAVA